MKKTGFTLVEIIVVLGVMTILGLILTNTLVQILRGENKVKIINQIKENGQSALDKMTNEIRLSGQVICTGSNNTSIDNLVLYKKDPDTRKRYTRYRFYKPTTTTNGYLAYDHLPFADQVTCTSGSQQLERQYLTDINPVTGVSLDYLTGETQIFTNHDQPGYPEVIDIKFKALPGVGAGTVYETQVKEGGIIFSTSVQVRGERGDR